MSVAGPSYRIGVLLYFRSSDGRILLIKRERAPNAGLWCAVGGKLEMELGESPYECAIREAKEEVGLELSESDLKLRCLLSEENYEESGHWLMFVFLVDADFATAPSSIDEGDFAFFGETDLAALAMPKMDRRILKERILPKEDGLIVIHAPVGADRNPDLLRFLQNEVR